MLFFSKVKKIYTALRLLDNGKKKLYQMSNYFSSFEILSFINIQVTFSVYLETFYEYNFKPPFLQMENYDTKSVMKTL